MLTMLTTQQVRDRLRQHYENPLTAPLANWISLTGMPCRPWRIGYIVCLHDQGLIEEEQLNILISEDRQWALDQLGHHS